SSRPHAPNRNARAAIDAASRMKRPCVGRDLSMCHAADAVATACALAATGTRGWRGWRRECDRAKRGDGGVRGFQDTPRAQSERSALGIKAINAARAEFYKCVQRRLRMFHQTEVSRSLDSWEWSRDYTP